MLEDNVPQQESISAKYDKFLKGADLAYEGQRVAGVAIKDMELFGKTVSPSELDWEGLAKEKLGKSHYGEYTINPEMSSLTKEDFKSMIESGRVKIFKAPGLVGHHGGDESTPIYKLAQDFVNSLSPEYLIPGAECFYWLTNDPLMMPDLRKFHENVLSRNGSLFLLGSVFYRNNGAWTVPSIGETDGSIDGRLYDLDDVDYPAAYVLVIKRENKS